MLKYASAVGPLQQKKRLNTSRAEYLTDPNQLVLPQTMPPPNMPVIGYLTQEHRHFIFPLYGRPTITNRAVWEYSTLIEDVLISLCTDPQRILATGDGVEVPNQPGVWRVTLYEPRFVIP